LPGAAFHLTARTSGHEHWWADDKLRSAVTGIVRDGLRRTDTRLIAFAIMTNHFHLTVRQGYDPLARLMHPICQRIALLVRAVHGREGHIFERRFRDKPCSSADHLRQVIYYTHRNPVKAGMCADASAYAWSSACAYTGLRRASTDDELLHPALTPALELFARTAEANVQEMHAGYLEFARWRTACDALPAGVRRPDGPLFPWGDVYSAQQFRVLPPPEGFTTRPDLRDLVLQALAELAPTVDLQLLRLRKGPRFVSAVRHQIITRAISAGHRGVTIARFLNVSEGIVSRVADEVYRKKSANAK
jgi:REP element-mobilizing transposase RayT